MTRRWRIKVTGKQKRNSDTVLCVRAVLALAEQIQREASTQPDVADEQRSGPASEAA